MGVDFEKIKELRQKIDELLKERPELLPLQQEIDSRMEAAGSQENRCAIINSMLMDAFYEFDTKLTKCRDDLVKELTDFNKPNLRLLEVVNDDEKT